MIVLDPLRLGSVLSVIALAALSASSRPVEPRLYEIDPSSRFDVKLGKAGLLGSFGHEHVIRAGTVSGTIAWDPGRAASSRVEVVVPVDDLHVVRQGADRDDWADVEKAMRTEVVHPARFPEITFRSRIVTRIRGGVHVVGDLTMEGRSRPVAVDVELEEAGDTLTARGAFAVRQTDFGIEPYSAAAGTIRVADEVEFDFEARGIRRSGE